MPYRHASIKFVSIFLSKLQINDELNVFYVILYVHAELSKNICMFLMRETKIYSSASTICT